MPIGDIPKTFRVKLISNNSNSCHSCGKVGDIVEVILYDKLHYRSHCCYVKISDTELVGDNTSTSEFNFTLISVGG